MPAHRLYLKVPDVGEVRATYARRDSGLLRGGLVLAHGANNDMNHQLLVAVDEAVMAAGFGTYRFNFPYRDHGGFTPDPAPVLQATARAAAMDAIRRFQLPPEWIVLGGKSLGARIFAQLVAQKYPTAGLLLLGYPLHSPGEPSKSDAEPFEQIRVPMMVLRGTLDHLCFREPLESLLEGIEAPTTLHDVAEGDHSFEAPRHSMRSTRQTWKEVVRVSTAWIQEIFPSEEA